MNRVVRRAQALTSRFTQPMFRIDLTTEEGRGTFAFPITLAATSRAPLRLDLTTVELAVAQPPQHLVGPDARLRQQGIGGTGGGASCWAQVELRSVWLPVPWRYLGRSFLRADDMAGSRDPGHYQDSGCPIQPDAKTITKGQTLSPDKTGGGLAAQCSPGLAVGVLVIAAVVLVRVVL